MSGSEAEKTGSESGRSALAEQLWERSEEGRKETNSEAEYRNREGTHGKPGGRERGEPKERKRGRRTEEATVGLSQEDEGKEAQRLSSQNPKLKRPKGRENSGGQKEKRKRREAVKVEAQRRPEAKAEGRGEPGEAAAENDAGGRRKEIADEAIRETACVEAERRTPRFHEA